MIKYMVEIVINLELCVGCGSCINKCPAAIYSLDELSNKPEINDLDNCLECKACEIQCKTSAISVNILI